MNNKKISGAAVAVAALSVLSLSSLAASSAPTAAAQCIPATKIEASVNVAHEQTGVTGERVEFTAITLSEDAQPAEMRYLRTNKDGSRVYSATDADGKEITITLCDQVEMSGTAIYSIEAQPAE